MRGETEWSKLLDNKILTLYDYKTPLNIFIDDFLKVEVDKIYIDSNVIEKILMLIKNSC